MIEPLALKGACDFCHQSFSLIVSAYTVTGCSECEAEDRVMEEERCWWESRRLANCDMLDSMDRWALLSIYGWLASSHGARHRFGTTGAVASAVASLRDLQDKMMHPALGGQLLKLTMKFQYSLDRVIVR